MSIVNWEKANEQSSHFKNTSPTKWAFTKEFLDKDFYQELYDTYPKFDSSYSIKDSYDTKSYQRFWKRDEDTNIIQEYDSRYSESWNKFMEYLWTGYGYFMEYFWIFYGYVMEYLWIFYGYFFKNQQK